MIRHYREVEVNMRQAINIEPKWHNVFKNLGVSLLGLSDYLEELLDQHGVVFLMVPEMRAEVEKCRQLVRRKGAA